MAKKPEILVIDDHLDSAKSYATLIQNSCSYVSVAVNNLDDAIKCIEQGEIKIVILDQNMPMLGTSMFVKLKELDDHLKFVMLTGEATVEDMSIAHNLKYSYIMLKNDIDKLPCIVFKLYADYNASLMRFVSNNGKPYFSEWKIGFFYIKRVHYYLLSYKIISNEEILENEWQTSHRIDSGGEETTMKLQSASKTTKFKVHTTQTASFSSLNKSLLDSALSIKLGMQNEQATTIQEERAHTRKLTLSEGETTENGEKIVSKAYQSNQVYTKILIHVNKKCPFCKEDKIIALSIYKPINKRKFRVIYYTENNNEIIIDTGVHSC